MTTTTVLEPVLLRQVSERLAANLVGLAGEQFVCSTGMVSKSMLRWCACGCGQAGPGCWYCEGAG